MIRVKKAEGLAMQTIVIAALVLVVLIVIVVIFTGGIHRSDTSLSRVNECPQPCVASSTGCGSGEVAMPIGCDTRADSKDETGKVVRPYCCKSK